MAAGASPPPQRDASTAPSPPWPSLEMRAPASTCSDAARISTVPFTKLAFVSEPNEPGATTRTSPPLAYDGKNLKRVAFFLSLFHTRIYGTCFQNIYIFG